MCRNGKSIRMPLVARYLDLILRWRRPSTPEVYPAILPFCCPQLTLNFKLIFKDSAAAEEKWTNYFFWKLDTASFVPWPRSSYCMFKGCFRHVRTNLCPCQCYGTSSSSFAIKRHGRSFSVWKNWLIFQKILEFCAVPALFPFLPTLP